MEGVAGNAPCEHFEADVLAQSCCQDCCHPEEAQRARHQVGRLPRVVGVVWDKGVYDVGAWPGHELAAEPRH